MKPNKNAKTDLKNSTFRYSTKISNFYTYFAEEKKSNFEYKTDRFADLGPGGLEPEGGGAGEGRADLEDSVEVVEAAADVGHGRPLLDGVHAARHLRRGHHLEHHERRHLNEEDGQN